MQPAKTSTYNELVSWIQPRLDREPSLKSTSPKKNKSLLQCFKSLSLSSSHPVQSSAPISFGNKNPASGKLTIVHDDKGTPLPNDVFRKILFYLDSQSLISARSVHSFWRQEIDALPITKEAKFRHKVVEQMFPTQIISIFETIDNVLHLPVYTFTESQCSRELENKSRPINFLPEHSLQHSMYRFVDPHGRFGFIFKIQNSQKHTFVITLHETNVAQSKKNQEWRVTRSQYTPDTHGHFPFEETAYKNEQLNKISSFFSLIARNNEASFTWDLGSQTVTHQYYLFC